MLVKFCIIDPWISFLSCCRSDVVIESLLPCRSSVLAAGVLSAGIFACLVLSSMLAATPLIA